MPYKQEICRAGKTKQYTFYYSARADQKGGSRRAKENKTSEAQKKVNLRQAIKKLTWILNENFDGTSLYITWSYEKDKRPAEKGQLKSDVEKLLRKLRKIYRKDGKEMKYVWVAERGERGAAHIHMVVNEIEARKLKKCWDKGWITIKPLDDSGQYAKLANYFVKYSEKTMKTEEGFGGKRYNSSKNLKIPEPEKKTVSSRKAYSHNIQIPSGWYLDRESINRGLKVGGVLLTAFKKTQYSIAAEEWLRKNCRHHVYDTKIRYSNKVDDWTYSKAPLDDFSKMCAAAIDYRKFIREYIGE